MPRDKKRKLPPPIVFKCPKCGHANQPSEIVRKDAHLIICAKCGAYFPGVATDVEK